MVNEVKIDMSLDDIISNDKKPNRTGRGRGRNGTTATRGFGFRFGGGKGFRGNRTNRLSGGGGSGIQKRRSGGNMNRGNRQIPEVWEHDMFDSPPSKKFNNAGSFGYGGKAKILVSNLDFGVNEVDLHELFDGLGNVQKASIHYDRSGRSLGTAEVVFERMAEATTAKKTYDGVPLDGRVMTIQIVGNQEAKGDVGVLAGRIGKRPFTNNRGGNRNTNNGMRGGQGRKTTGGKKVAPTAEELDADLDAYNSKMET